MDIARKCACCYKRAHKTRCSACKSVYYCCQTCQKKDWKSHKLVCSDILENRRQNKSLVNVLLQWNDSYNKKDNFFKILGAFMDTGTAKEAQVKSCEITKAGSWFKNNENMIPRRTRCSKDFPDGEWVIEAYNKNDEKPESMRFLIFKLFIDSRKYIRDFSFLDFAYFSDIFREKLMLLLQYRKKIQDYVKKYPELFRSPVSVPPPPTYDSMFFEIEEMEEEDEDDANSLNVNINPLIPEYVKYRPLLCDNLIFWNILEFMGYEDYSQDFFCSIDFTYNSMKTRQKRRKEEDDRNNKIVLRCPKDNVFVLDKCSSINTLVADGLFNDKYEAAERIVESRNLKKNKFKLKVQEMRKRQKLKRKKKEEELEEDAETEKKEEEEKEEIEIFEEEEEKVKILRNDAVVMGSQRTRTTPSPESLKRQKNKIVFDDGLFLIRLQLNRNYEPTIYHDVSKQNLKTKKRLLSELNAGDSIFKILEKLDEQKNKKGKMITDGKKPNGRSKQVQEFSISKSNSSAASALKMMMMKNNGFNIHNVGKGVGVGLNELNLDEV